MDITKELIYRYFRGEASDSENNALDGWLARSEENRQEYRRARMEYEFMLMNADIHGMSAGRKSVSRKRNIRICAAVISNVAVMAAVFILSAIFTEDRITDRLSDNRMVVDVPPGQRMTLTLPDSTVVCLNSGTRLSCPAVFYGRERRVELEGEAMFRVSHDARHPFIVETFAADIKVLGTEFNVYADSEEQSFSTSLISGKVSVTSSSSPEMNYILRPDHTLILRNGRFYVEDMLDNQMFYWTEGLINLHNMEFDALMSRFEKAFGVEIVIETESLPELDCVSGEIRISDGVDHALKVLQHIADFNYSRDNRTGTIYIR